MHNTAIAKPNKKQQYKKQPFSYQVMIRSQQLLDNVHVEDRRVEANGE
jgi:hypothetical protein